MTGLRRNVSANIAAAVFSGVAMLATAPLLLRWLGADAYGLVGLHTSALSLMLVFDVGLSIALNREIAWLNAAQETAPQIRSVIRTAVPIYWAIGIAFAVAMSLTAPLMADRWLDDTSLPRATVIDALRWLAVALAAHLVSLAYIAGLLGLQRQTLYSVLWAVSVALRLGGGTAIAFATRDVRAFFVAQAVATILYVVMLAVALHRVMPAGRAEKRPDLLRGAWQLARGAAIIGVLSAITTQADKLAVSRAVPLETFGHYSLATLLAMITAGGIMPLTNAALPRFAQLLRMDDREELLLTYRRVLQTMVALIVPVAVVLSVWSYEVLFVWTGQRDVAATQANVTVLLVVGMSLYGLSTIPYKLQLAHAWTAPAMAMNAIGLLTFVPAMFVAAAKYGALGTAVVYATMHAVFLLWILIATHRRLLRGAGWTFVRDVAPPLMASMLIAAGGRLLLPHNADRMVTAISLAIVGTVAFLATAAITPAWRRVEVV